MKFLPVDVHPEAVAEAQAATQWYRERSASVANALRLLMKRFPFSVVFRLTSNRIEVAAIAHGRRKPGYWKGRLA